LYILFIAFVEKVKITICTKTSDGNVLFAKIAPVNSTSIIKFGLCLYLHREHPLEVWVRWDRKEQEGMAIVVLVGPQMQDYGDTLALLGLMVTWVELHLAETV
jgi:hypothetical protein